MVADVKDQIAEWIVKHPRPCLLELNHVDCLARRQYRREVREYAEHYTDSACKQLANDKRAPTKLANSLAN